MSFAVIQPWLYSIVFGFLSVAIIISNYWYLFDARRRKGTTSLTLFIGGMLGVIAILTVPIIEVKYFFFIPLLIDPGTSLIVIGVIKDQFFRK